MRTCEEFRRALGRLRDGEAPPEEAREARAHAEGCAACRSDAALLEAVAFRLRERGGDGAAPAGLREAVLARVRRGEAAILDLHPFLRRAAVAAAAVFVAAGAAALWQASRPGAHPSLDAGIPREEILAEIGRPRLGPGR